MEWFIQIEHIFMWFQPQTEIESYRKLREMHVKGRDVPKPIATFEEGTFPRHMLECLYQQGFKEPTPIQAQGWPMAISGRDFVGIAQTGSGKTLGVRSFMFDDSNDCCFIPCF